MKCHLQCAILLDIFIRTNIAVRMSWNECRIICTLDFLGFFFIKLFHTIIIMIKAAFCLKCICCFLNALNRSFFSLKSLTLQILFNNTNIVKEHSML